MITKSLYIYRVSVFSIYVIDVVYFRLFNVNVCTIHSSENLRKSILLYEYRDLFIDMAVRNNRSELAIANRHQER